MALARRVWTITQTITRPANTTQYTAGDGVSTATTGTILTFAGVAPAGKMGGRITSLYVHKTDQDEVEAAFDLNLFDTTVAVAGFEDNNAIAITDAEWQTGVGVISLAASEWKSVVTGSVWSKGDLNYAYQCAAGTSLFGVLVARDTYTPASAEVFTIRLTGEVY